MTKSTEDLVQHIPKVRISLARLRALQKLTLRFAQAHLVRELGGTSEWKWQYPPIVPGENAPQQCVRLAPTLR